MSPKGIRETVRRWLALPRVVRRALLRAWVMGAVCAGGLHILNYERTLSIVRRMSRSYELRLDQFAWIVNAASGRVPGAKCLVRAMVAEALLSASGHPAEICFGVSKEGGFGAHAWVEVEGQTVIGGNADRPYERLTPRGANTA